jgi:hypothetical protein
MKLSHTFYFLVVSIIIAYVGSKLQNLQNKQMTGDNRSMGGIFLFTLVVLFLTFLQFYILTDVFPLYLILTLVGALALSSLIYQITGAVAGFSLPQKQQKIGVLTKLWGFKNAYFGCGIMVIALISLLLSWGGSLYVYWHYAVGDPRAKVYIAFLQFTLPQLMVILGALVVTWPTVTSQYYDDDFRNSYLANSFSSIIFSTIFLLFPIWMIFKEDLTGPLGWELPPFWVMLSIPILFFLASGMIPFFVGMFRYRSQNRIMLNWRKTWLEQILPLCKMEESEIHTKLIEKKIQELNNEIDDCISSDEILRYYQDLKSPGVPPDNQPPPPVEKVLEDEIKNIIKENRSHLVNWDIRFSYLDELLQLRDVVTMAKSEDICAIIEDKLKNIAGQQEPPRNFLAGSIYSGLSGVLVWLFNHFQNEIIAAIGKLAPLK